MKIRHPLAITSAAFAISLWLRAWRMTLRLEERVLDPAYNLHSPQAGAAGRCIYILWHENILVPAAFYATTNVPVLISQHRDGELVTQVLQFLGGSAVRGSSTRGGGAAIRELLAALQDRSIAITPDGPRGPRRVLQQGAVFLASHAGIPVVPIGVHTLNAWHTKSWDRFAIAKPFSKARAVLGKPIHVPPGLDKDALAPYIELCQKGMDETQQMAEAGW